MLSSPDLSFSRTLPIVVFNQLGELLEQMAQRVESAALVLTEAVLVRICIPVEWQRQRFTLVVCEQFSALLVGNFEEEQGSRGAGEQGIYSALNAQLTFNLEAIASFIYELRDLFECDSYTHQNLERYRQIIRPNDATLQSQFSLLLLEYLLTQPNQEIIADPSPIGPAVYICQPVEDALKKQISQERLLNQVTTQIRKSLDLPVIMATAITQVREFLELDRLVIYKFAGSQVKARQYQSDIIPLNETALPTDIEPSVREPAEIYFSIHENNGKHSPFVSVNNQPLLGDCQKNGGYIVYEARATDAITSVLNYTEKNCFIRTSQCWEKYRQGFTLAVDDVEKTYALEECLLNFLRECQVRAKLAAPIMFEDKLWGLLIAHQCDRPHEWNDSEKNLLVAIAEQLAIAIHQAELMQTLTQEKQNLEQRVIERTMALRVLSSLRKLLAGSKVNFSLLSVMNCSRL
ncbi:GAF domain-containing protein [Nostoc sp. 'Lobaria pulmonaria (5183) cyanobiont']|uniref:GAF domain-containing protein n=1 Tax=Nostoc sp. 'Lobaria pulmonaria (5183) cyanobiont' TaxID=1618022 RepID=UPI003FA5E432